MLVVKKKVCYTYCEEISALLQRCLKYMGVYGNFKGNYDSLLYPLIRYILFRYDEVLLYIKEISVEEKNAL